MHNSRDVPPKSNWISRLNLTFAHIPAGDFSMGSPPTEPLRFDNEALHRVHIAHPFLMSVSDITVAQFAAFIADTHYKTTAEKEGWAYGVWNAAANRWDKLAGASWRNPGIPQTPNHPVVDVSWHDAVAFCRWLSEKERKTYRLPTEAEWEYACRAGSQSAYFWGNDPDAGAGFANCLDQSAKERFTLFPPFNWTDGFVYTSPAASFKPNQWGLYDMLGNTLQWCSDYFTDYPTDAATDPAPSTGQQHNLRGGAFVYGPKHSRCAFRGRNDPGFRNYYIDFRIVSSDR
ncbi:MAG TPA: formylglycine-generating enzyme family protein [Tepidisphaeraceae bacterium]|jgi:formylglycine-generating enzyme required for sulfatase activity|nr:formylglycine-generating enzyme family protein [Tepidisphaeraceae bacterium]